MTSSTMVSNYSKYDGIYAYSNNTYPNSYINPHEKPSSGLLEWALHFTLSKSPPALSTIDPASHFLSLG